MDGRNNNRGNNNDGRRRLSLISNGQAEKRTSGQTAWQPDRGPLAWPAEFNFNLFLQPSGGRMDTNRKRNGDGHGGFGAWPWLSYVIEFNSSWLCAHTHRVTQKYPPSISTATNEDTRLLFSKPFQGIAQAEEHWALSIMDTYPPNACQQFPQFPSHWHMATWIHTNTQTPESSTPGGW